MIKGLDPATEGGRLAEQHLRDDIVGWFTTVAPDGRPQSSVISFLWDGETILFYSKPDTRGNQRAADDDRAALRAIGSPTTPRAAASSQ